MSAFGCPNIGISSLAIPKCHTSAHTRLRRGRIFYTLTGHRPVSLREIFRAYADDIFILLGCFGPLHTASKTTGMYVEYSSSAAIGLVRSSLYPISLLTS